jgi:hypothetical protein
MYAGSGPFGGGALFPGLVFQPTPQFGVSGFFANPLKAAGAEPPLREFFFHHCAPQKVTFVPIALFLSPITNEPPPGANANTSVWQVATVWLPPTSLIVVVIVNGPVDEYVCEPETVYGPLPVPGLTVPDELELSPQSIVALKSALVANGFASVNVAVGPANTFNEVAAVAHCDVNGASATVAVECAVSVLLVLLVSVITTVIG